MWNLFAGNVKRFLVEDKSSKVEDTGKKRVHESCMTITKSDLGQQSGDYDLTPVLEAVLKCAVQ